MPNLQPADYRFRTDLVCTSYRMFQRKKTNCQNLLVEATIGSKLLDNYPSFTKYEIQSILFESVRTVLNLVPQRMNGVLD